MSSVAFVTGGSGFIGGHLIERLVGDGWIVRALARSERAAVRVAQVGAEPVAGALDSSSSIREAARDAQVVFHLAACVADWAPRDEYVRANVCGTASVLAACRAAGVGRLVHLSTEAVHLAGRPLVGVNETAPLRPDSPASYPATKARAETLVLDSAADGFTTVAVRPRLVWGPRDATILPGLVDAVRGGRFAWIGGGTQLTDTTHVANVTEALLLAARHGQSGRAYFVTDGHPTTFRDFVVRLLATVGVEPPARNIPVQVAAALAAVGEQAWQTFALPGRPPLTRMAMWLSALECTIDTSRARTELGYLPIISRDEGLAALTAGEP
jgi:nucleoside-diphosphate-sugar epimerase